MKRTKDSCQDPLVQAVQYSTILRMCHNGSNHPGNSVHSLCLQNPRTELQLRSGMQLCWLFSCNHPGSYLCLHLRYYTAPEELMWLYLLWL